LSGALCRHGRACPGHPRLSYHQGVDARHKAGHDGADAASSVFDIHYDFHDSAQS
jgi:hypothetical protein